MKALEMKTNQNGVTLGFHGPYLSNTNGWQGANLKPSTTYVCIMIELPEGYRLVTEEERRIHRKPNCAMWLEDSWVRCNTSMSSAWQSHRIYAIPIGHTWAERVNVEKLERELEEARATIKRVQEKLGNMGK